MKSSTAAIVLVLAALSCSDDEDTASTTSPRLDVTFVGAVNNVVPFGPGGTFNLDLSAQVAGLAKAPTATIEYVDPTNTKLPASTTTTLSLAAGGKVAQRVQLAYPKGPPFAVRIHALGTQLDQEVPLDLPVLQAVTGPAEQKGAFIVQTLCVEATVTGGEVDVTLQNATFTNGAATSRLTFQEGDCGIFVDRPFRRRAQASVRTTGSSFVVDGQLVGTEFRLPTTTLPTTVLGPILLTIAPTPPATAVLPEAGAAIELDLTATVNGVGAQALPFTFEVIPDTAKVLPASGVTDANGKAHATLIAPEKGTSVRIDAVAGGNRGGLTLSR